jgi:hypothetical protein
MKGPDETKQDLDIFGKARTISGIYRKRKVGAPNTNLEPMLKCHTNPKNEFILLSIVGVT